MQTSLIDFSLPVSSRQFEPRRIVSQGGVHAFCGYLHPHEDGLIGTSQLSVVVHDSAPFMLEWTDPGSNRPIARTIKADMLHVAPGDRPRFLRWTDRPSLTGLAFDRTIADRVGVESFGRGSDSIRWAMAVRDRRLLAIMRAVREEVAGANASDGAFIEHLGMLAAILLFRHYSDAQADQRIMRGGLGNYRLNKVLGHIDTQMENRLRVPALAEIAGLGPQHFSAAFLASTGLRPHRFILNRRIERAKLLLLTTDMPIAEISLAVGFASQSHFAERFRETTGVTPLRFRLERMQ